MRALGPTAFRMFKVAGIMVFLQSTTIYADPPPAHIYDFIVVGNGQTGAVVARNLADQLVADSASQSCIYKNDVLVLDAGYHYDPLAFPLVVDPNATGGGNTSSNALGTWPYSMVWPYIRLFGTGQGP